MITFRELFSGVMLHDIPISHQHNLEELHKKINIIRTAWNKPMIVTSGYRFMSDHIRIYSEINSRRKKQGLPELKIPMGSSHLIGAAVDIYDPNSELFDWCKTNIKLLEQVGLWCEEKDNEPRVHFQIYPPRSGKRFFKA